MTSILTDWGKKILEKLISRAIAESRFVFCFTCIVKEFEEEKAKLEPEIKTLAQRTKVAIGKNKDIQANVDAWKEEVDKLTREETNTKQTCFFGFCPDCIWRYTRGKELSNKKQNIKRLLNSKFENIELPRRVPDVERYSSQDYISFKSREADYQKLLDALKDDNNYLIGLQGMGGTGKTTLAKEVGKELKQSEQFAHVIVTTISFTPNIKKIQDDIAGPLGLELKNCNESDRPGTLWDRLTKGEKVLLILDDVWDEGPVLDFDEIGIPKRDKHKGCTVLITTRSKKIFNQMNFNKIIELKLLSEEDAWIMFEKYADISNRSSKHVIAKGRKIVKECKQLPVAIAVIARSLKGQEDRVHQWDVTLKSLKKIVSIHGVGDDVIGIYKCLQYSYDNMNDEKAKRLFLLCSVFPEDEVISDEVLTRVAIGAGLFGEDYGIYNDARDQVAVAKSTLIDSCLLLEVNKKHVKMHDLVRDVAQWIAKKKILAVNLSNENEKLLVEREADIRYLFCKGKDKDLFSCKFDGSKLETLIVAVDEDGDEDGTIPNSFFQNIVKLRVFQFFGNYILPLSLQHSIQRFTNIRSVKIAMVDLGDISILGKIQSLETLDLVRCTINELPSDFAKLKKFKLLNLERCGIRMNNPFEVIEKCSSLEELYFINSFNEFCQEITLPELQRYQILKGWNFIKDRPSKYVDFDWRGGGSEESCFSKGALEHFMQTAEVIRLMKINSRWRNLMPELVPIDQDMNDLVELILEDDSELECLIDTKVNASQVPNVFSKMVLLKLKHIKNLEELCNGPISVESMKNLEELTISSCKKLRSLFKCSLNFNSLKTIKITWCSMLVSVFELSTSRSLLELENLEIDGCTQLESIFTHDDTTEEILVDNDNSKSCNSMFPKLKVVNIESCPKLQFILPLLSDEDLFLLETIKIRKCGKLEYIFEQHQDVKLASLKELELNDVPNFIDIFPKSDHIIEESSDSISKPETQLQVEPIKSNIFSCCYRYKSSTKPLVSDDPPQASLISKESSSYCLNIWEHAQCLSRLSHMVCNMKVIKLMKLSKKIKSVFILSIAPKMSLESLTITNCAELKNIIVDIGDGSGGNNIVFPKLKELNIKNCNKLEYIFGHINNASDDHDQNSSNEIQLHLQALESLKLSSLPSLIRMCPKQYHISFSPLKQLELGDCSQVDVNSIGDFTVLSSISRYQDSTAIKQLSGNMEHFLALEKLTAYKSKIESILCLNDEISERQINLGMEDIFLHNLPLMINLFVGPKNSFTLKNLTRIYIFRCEKMEIVFSTSILKCLSQLSHLRIEECKELKHTFEDDFENQRMSNSISSKTCFPMLKAFAVVKCNKLKSVFPISMSYELPKLEALLISEADELEEIFKSVGDNQKVEIPNLKVAAFVNLPSLCNVQGIQFQAVRNRFVQNCKNLSLTSSSSDRDPGMIVFQIKGIDDSTYRDMSRLFRQLHAMPKGPDFANGIEVQVAEHKLTSSQKEINQAPDAEHEFIENVPNLEIPPVATLPTNSKESMMNQQNQHPLGEIDTTVNTSRENNLEGPMSTIISETSNVPLIHSVDRKQKGVAISVEEEGTISANVKTITSSIHLELASSSSSDPLVTSVHKTSSQEYGDSQIAIPSFSISTRLPVTIKDVDFGDSHETTQTTNQGSLNDDSFKKVSSNIEEQIPEDDDDVRVSKSRISSIASLFPSTTSKGLLDGEKVQTTSGHELTSSHKNGIVSNISGLEIPSVANSPTNSQELLNEQSTSQQRLTKQQHLLEEANTTVNKPSQEKNCLQEIEDQSIQKGSTKLHATLGKVIVNTKLHATKDVDIGDSQEIIAMEDINKLIEEDPLLALEKLLTGVRSFSIGSLLQELKTLMDSLSDLDHLVSNQESKSKLISLFHGLNQHQGLLPSDVKEFVEKVQNFFSDNIIKHATFQQVLKKHNQLLDSKTELMNKLWSAKSTQTHIDSETSTANGQIHELSLQIDELRKKLEDLENQKDGLKSVVNKCDIQKKKLKAECTEWAQQSKELLSALASTEVDVREAERARNSAKEGLANFKASFPTF